MLMKKHTQGSFVDNPFMPHHLRGAIGIDHQFVFLADIQPERRCPGHEIVFDTERQNGCRIPIVLA